MQKSAIFLMGPTAVGKTALAIDLTQHLPCDIISVDSAMVYRGMDIGTGKPSKVELEKAPHRLIDICDPSEPYSAAQFCSDATIAMQETWSKNRIPLLVGGTMLYFKALQFGLAPLPSANPQLRSDLLKQAEELGWPAMHAKLASMDPMTAARLSVNDKQRIQRALEINILSGQTLDVLHQVGKNDLSFKLHNFCLLPTERSLLHQKIEQRFVQMLAHGLVDEVEVLYKRGDLHTDLPSIRSVGYRQVWSYLAQDIDYVTMCAQALAATRQLAKRQLTWLRSWPGIINMDSSNNVALDTIVRSVLESSQNNCA